MPMKLTQVVHHFENQSGDPYRLVFDSNGKFVRCVFPWALKDGQGLDQLTPDRMIDLGEVGALARGIEVVVAEPDAPPQPEVATGVKP